MDSLYLAAYRILLPRRYRRYLERADGDKDMVRETLLHGTFYEEYRLYGFASKSEAERRSYLTDAVRNKICRKANNRRGQRIILDKWLTYNLFSDYYRRKAWLLEKESDIVPIAAEGMQYGRLVAKPVDKCGGHGVQLLQCSDERQWRERLAALLDKRGRWIVEECIVQDEPMARWNRDTVNTIRMNTIMKGDIVTHYTPFILSGRKGNFVNNGAQGGLFASINVADGRIATDAYDENGNRYECHPDSGTPFCGEQIPRWNELLEITATMARRLPGVTYVGWDIALSLDGWVCVEANKGEFVAQQTTLGRGLRKEFEQLCGI